MGSTSEGGEVGEVVGKLIGEHAVEFTFGDYEVGKLGIVS